MTIMDYDDATAERLEAIYLGPDIVAQRADTLHRLNIGTGDAILDIGSGPGFLATDLAKATGPTGRVVGIDISSQFVARAQGRNRLDWLSYEVADALSLPFAADTFDVVVSTQVAEYVPDIRAFCAEIFRVLKPGGRALVLATDWDAVCWHSEVPARMQQVLAGFAPHCADSRLPRTLKRHLQNAGLTFIDVGYFPIINTDRYDGCYSEGIVPLIRAYVESRKVMSSEALADWACELDSLNSKGEHFFSSGRFSFLATKPA